MKTRILFCLLFILLIPFQTFAHSGRTDSYGGHNKTSNGTYHCHSGKCLEDAREQAYQIAFPIGQEDGRLGENEYKEYESTLWERVREGTIDTDQAEYMIPYLLRAYKEGYEDTYIPTFWEKYKYYMIGLFGLSFWVVPPVFQKYKNKKVPTN